MVFFYLGIVWKTKSQLNLIQKYTGWSKNTFIIRHMENNTMAKKLYKNMLYFLPSQL